MIDIFDPFNMSQNEEDNVPCGSNLQIGNIIQENTIPKNDTIKKQELNYPSKENDIEPQFIEVEPPSKNFSPMNTVSIDEYEYIPDKENKPINNKKYRILDLFWLMREDIINKILLNENIEDNLEAHAITISFNVDFGNLRIEFYKLNKNSIQNHILFHQAFKSITKITIYPFYANKILYNEINQIDDPIYCFEQLFNNTYESWIKNLNQLHVMKGPLTQEGWSLKDLLDNNWTLDLINQDENLKKIFSEKQHIQLRVFDQNNNLITYFKLNNDYFEDCFIKSLNFAIDKGFQLRGNKL